MDAKQLRDSQSVTSGNLSGYRNYIGKKWIILGVLFGAMLVLALVAVNAGAASINPWQVLKTLLGAGDEKASLVIWRMRLPRVTAAIVAGSGLAIAGCVMQNNLKNPLASPLTLGISHAAAFGANVAIIVLGAGTVLNRGGDAVSISNPYLVTICSFVCAMGAMLIILSLAKLRGFTPESIVLAGVALNAIFTAGVTVIQYFAQDTEIAAAIFWTFGDLGRASWIEVLIMTIVVVVSIIYFIFRRWDYNALDHGEETAKSLGVHTERVRAGGLFASALITAVAVSFLGIIGFIGIISPQIMRRILGSDHRFLIPASALGGAVLLLVADILARTIMSPVVLPVGTVTSMCGAPLFLYLLMRGKKR